MSDAIDAIWINTEPSVDGKAFVVTISAGDDIARTLDRAAALEYATGVLRAAAYAEYDAAVAAQHRSLTTKGSTQVDNDAIAQLVKDLRADRPPLDPAVTYPIALAPGVSQANGKAFLALDVAGQTVGQWTVADAREHALVVIEAVTTADLDAAYLRMLRGPVGLDEGTARAVVGDILNHREAVR